MKLNTKHISPGESKLEFSSSCDGWMRNLAAEVQSRDYCLKAPISVSFSVTKVEPDFFMRGNLQSAIVQPCARCAENFTLVLNHRFEIAFSQLNSRHLRSTVKRSGEIDELDINFFDGHEIDLAPVIEEQFFLAIPFQSVCNPDCKGICQACGANQNTAPCECSAMVSPGLFSILDRYRI